MRAIALFLLLALGGCTTGFLVTNYTGQDGGFLVSSLGARSDTVYSSYSLYYRKKDRAPDGNGTIWWGQASLIEGRARDFDDGGQTGIVDVRRLPPGDYELFNFQFLYNDGTVQKTYRSKQEFSIPFSILPGRGTYIGEFIAVGLFGKNILGITVSDGGYFVVANKSDRDIPIARRKRPDLPEVQVSVPDPKLVGNPLIRAAALEARQ